MTNIRINSIIEEAESLKFEDQVIFIDLFQKRFNERLRDEIAKNAELTLRAVKNKKAKIGSVQDFLNDVENEEI